MNSHAPPSSSSQISYTIINLISTTGLLPTRNSIGQAEEVILKLLHD